MRQTPTQEIFDDMKSAATTVWNEYDNTYGYVTKKLDYINSLSNIEDNAMVFFRMFDWVNQATMMNIVNKDSLNYIKENL
jgi:hypothetical protein